MVMTLVETLSPNVETSPPPSYCLVLLRLGVKLDRQRYPTWTLLPFKLPSLHLDYNMIKGSRATPIRPPPPLDKLTGWPHNSESLPPPSFNFVVTAWPFVTRNCPHLSRPKHSTSWVPQPSVSNATIYNSAILQVVGPGTRCNVTEPRPSNSGSHLFNNRIDCFQWVIHWENTPWSRRGPRWQGQNRQMCFFWNSICVSLSMSLPTQVLILLCSATQLWIHKFAM